MGPYAITDPARPWVVLFSAPTLAEIADALRAQPDPWNLDVRFAEDGFARALTGEEWAALQRAVP